MSFEMSENILYIGERILTIRKALNLTQEQFAKRLKLNKGTISNVEKNRQKVSGQLVRLICLEFVVSEDWLKTGEGEMFISPEEAIKNQMARFGKQAFVEAFKKILEEENQTGTNNLSEAHNNQDPELRRMLGTLQDLWAAGDNQYRSWISVQFDYAFPRSIVDSKLQETHQKEQPLQKKRHANMFHESPSEHKQQLAKPAKETDDINLDEIMLVAEAEGREILRPPSPELKAIAKEALKVSRQRRKEKESKEE